MCKGLSETEARASHAVFVGRGRAPILQRSWEGWSGAGSRGGEGNKMPMASIRQSLLVFSNTGARQLARRA